MPIRLLLGFIVGVLVVVIIADTQNPFSGTASVTEGGGQTQSNVRVGTWEIYLGDSGPVEVGNRKGGSRKQGQGEGASILESVKGGESRSQKVTGQAGQQGVVSSHACVTVPGAKTSGERVDVRKGTATTREQEASAHSEKGKEHPEDIEEEEAEGVQTGNRQSGNLWARWLVKNTGIKCFAGQQRPKEKNSMHSSESNTGGESTSKIVEGQTVLGSLNGIGFVFVVIILLFFFGLGNGSLDDVLDLEVDVGKEGTEDELEKDSGNNGSHSAAQPDDGIQNVPDQRGRRYRQQVEESRRDGNDQELWLGKDNLKEGADKGSEADGRGTKHQRYRIGRVTSHC